MDGRADEEVWRRAPVDDRFVERSPQLGGRPARRTSFQVAYDDQALYFLVRIHMPPKEIRVRTLRRDSFGIFSDDNVIIKIDPLHDHRTSYTFGINADGAQIDTLALEDGKVFLRQWDGVWQAETRRTSDGFIAEIRIPFAIMGVTGTGSRRTMGLNITTDRSRANATYDWSLIVPPASPAAASNYGHLTGIEGIQGQRALEIIPFILGRTDFTRSFSVDPRKRPNLSAGGGARIQVGRASYIEGSVLTDFAQVEVDNVQVANDRFPLFFPERRPFFINGLETFNFGVQREAQLFFSRRVGLVNRQPVAIAGGLKAYGREGRVSYGILQVQTLGSKRDDTRGLPNADPENVSVGRVRVQATDTVNIGAMMLGKHVFRTGDLDAASGGMDAQLISPGGKVQWYGFVAGTWAESPKASAPTDEDGAPTAPATPAQRDLGTSAYSSLEYRGLYVRPRASWLWSDTRFNPVMGFYRRPGTARQTAAIDFAPRPTQWGLREIIVGPSFSLETDPLYTKRLTQNASGRIAFNWRTGESLSYSVSHFRDDVQFDFVLYGHGVPAALYSGVRQNVSLSTNGRHPVQFTARYAYGEDFGGVTHRPSASLRVRAGKHLTFSGTYTHLVGHLSRPEDTFNFGFANGSLDLAFTRNLAIDNVLRLDLSPGSQRFGLQSRLRWRFLPGSDIFVVYRNNLPILGNGAIAPFHELIVKMTYYIRAVFPRRA